MKIRFLGTGTSQGVPVIACKCEVCLSKNPKDKRLRSSILIENEAGNTVVIDTGPDFRQQILRENIERLDAVVFTHEHKDHIAGLDDIRAFNFVQQRDMDVYATQRVQEALKRDFHYAFQAVKYPGVPQMNLHTIDLKPFKAGGFSFIPIEVMHYRLPVLGFRIGDFTYITDANYISPEEKEKVKGSKVLVLNALRQSKHISHFTLNEAIELAQELGANKTYFTHLSHQMGLHTDVNSTLPEGVHLAYDSLVIEI